MDISVIEHKVLPVLGEVYPALSREQRQGFVSAIEVLCTEFPQFCPDTDVYRADLRQGPTISIGIRDGLRGKPLFGLRIAGPDGAALLGLRMDGEDREALLRAWGIEIDSRLVDAAWNDFRRSPAMTFALSELAQDSEMFRGVVRDLKRRSPDVVARRMRGTLSVGCGGVEQDLEAVVKQPAIDGTQRLAQILARIGQGRFREDVLQRWGRRCAVTGIDLPQVIRASHIKPWSASNDPERLCADNGLPLVATLDALFDAFLISFDDDGNMLTSSRISDSAKEKLGLSADMKLRQKISPKQAEFLAYHREHFRKGQTEA